MQLIITHELTKEKNYWLQSLRSNITDSEEIRNLAEHYEEYQDEVLYSNMMNAIVNANWDMFEEEKAMCKCEALRCLFEPDIQAAAKAAAEEAAEAATKTATEKRLKQDISICIGRFKKMQIPCNDVVKIIAEDYSMNEKEVQNCVDECWTAYYYDIGVRTSCRLFPVGKIKKQNLLQKFSKKYKNLTKSQTGTHPACGFFMIFLLYRDICPVLTDKVYFFLIKCYVFIVAMANDKSHC